MLTTPRLSEMVVRRAPALSPLPSLSEYLLPAVRTLRVHKVAGHALTQREKDILAAKRGNALCSGLDVILAGAAEHPHVPDARWFRVGARVHQWLWMRRGYALPALALLHDAETRAVADHDVVQGTARCRCAATSDLYAAMDACAAQIETSQALMLGYAREIAVREGRLPNGARIA